MLDLVNKHKVHVLDHGARTLDEHLYRADAISIRVLQVVPGAG